MPSDLNPILKSTSSSSLIEMCTTTNNSIEDNFSSHVYTDDEEENEDSIVEESPTSLSKRIRSGLYSLRRNSSRKIRRTFTFTTLSSSSPSSSPQTFLTTFTSSLSFRKRKESSTKDGDNSSSSGGSNNVFKDVTSSSYSPGPDAQIVGDGLNITGSSNGNSSGSYQSTPPSMTNVDALMQQQQQQLNNGSNQHQQQQLSSAESDKSSNRSGSQQNKKKSKSSLDSNYLLTVNTNNNNGGATTKENGGDLTKNCSKESIFTAASGTVGASPSPKLPVKNESRKSMSAPLSANVGQEKTVISQLKNFLAPNYKSRNEEFKRLFKVPESEKFIIDYSCAYQREILVHGRMYLSQNWMCFYANIFKWETTLTIPLKDITKISKERTAKVIPNAIQFEQPADLWAWAQQGYNEADLSDSQDDDDDGGSVLTDNSGVAKGCDNVVCTNTPNSKTLKTIGSSKVEFTLAQAASDDVDDSENDAGATVRRRRRGGNDSPTVVASTSTTKHKRHKKASSALLLNTPTVLPASADGDDYSESSQDDGSATTAPTSTAVETQCNCTQHEGKEMLNEIFPISVDQMFLLLFTDSVFFRQLQEFRKTTNLNMSEWHTDKSNGVKSRQLCYTVALNHSMGPKSCGVTEKQICAQCGKNGRVYVVKCECQNIGVPYADTFYAVTTYCMNKVAGNQCRLRVHGGVVYRKSCWGIVKSFIEKNALVGIQDYFSDLSNQLRGECERLGLTPEPSARDLLARKPSAKSQGTPDELYSPTTGRKRTQSIVFPLIPSEIESLTKAILLILILMLLLNAMLFYKLWYFEAQSERISFETTLYDLQKLLQKPELTSAEWMRLFHQERIIHRKQSTKWADGLQDMLSAVEQIESALKDLRDQMGSIKREFLSSHYVDDDDAKLNEQKRDDNNKATQTAPPMTSHNNKKPLRDKSGL